MPKKVSPECFIQLCQRVNILQEEKKQKKKERSTGAQAKGTGNLCSNDYYIVLKVQAKRTGRHIIRAQVIRDKEKL